MTDGALTAPIPFLAGRYSELGVRPSGRIYSGYPNTTSSGGGYVWPNPALPTFDPATHAAVPVMTAKAAEQRYRHLRNNARGDVQAHVAHLVELGIIRREPDPVDDLAAVIAKTPHVESARKIAEAIIAAGYVKGQSDD